VIWFIASLLRGDEHGYNVILPARRRTLNGTPAVFFVDSRRRRP
jgi:hypothetical protein